MELLSDYLLTHHREDITNILSDDTPGKHFSISINFMQLFEENTSVGNSILTSFESTISQCESCLKDVQNEILRKMDYGSIKENVHIRVFSLPSCPVFPGNEDLGLFLQITGTVIRTSVAKILEYRRAYKCTKCKDVVIVDADFYQKFLIQPPKRCRNPDCKANNFIKNSEMDIKTCRDYQEIKIQEQISQARYGCLPNSLWAILEDDLVDSCKPGDNITICGVIKRQVKPLMLVKKVQAQIVIKANHIQVNNDTSTITIITPDMKQSFISFWDHYYKNPLEGRDIIVRSFCPHVYGLHLVKLAMLVTLAGGSKFQQKNDSGVKTRSEPHILLVGDPGTAKSQFLRAAAKIIMRSVLTTGVGSTSAGLTVTAIREGNEWQLEAGALVLSDGGICCIDEFNSMKEHDRTSIHEAMEQQTISVAKAGIVCKLNTRCSILAATNPKGSWDSKHPITINIGLPSPLLSRFDLVFILRDTVDKDWDKVVANYILNDCTDFEEKEDNLWTLEMLQAYFITIKKLNPALTESSNKILAAYYQFQRRAATRNKARTTVRLLDSLIRLSQAHAKLMFHTEVEIMDVIMAVVLIETSMQRESSVLSLNIDIRKASSENPGEMYVQTTRTILEKLELFDILEKELNDYYRRYSGVIENPQRRGKLWKKLNSNFIKRKKSFSIVYKKNGCIDETINSLSFNSTEETNIEDTKVISVDSSNQYADNFNMITSSLHSNNKLTTFNKMVDIDDMSVLNIDDIQIQSVVSSSNSDRMNTTQTFSFNSSEETNIEDTNVVSVDSSNQNTDNFNMITSSLHSNNKLTTFNKMVDIDDMSVLNIDDIQIQSVVSSSNSDRMNTTQTKKNSVQDSPEKINVVISKNEEPANTERVNGTPAYSNNKKSDYLNIYTSSDAKKRKVMHFDDIENTNNISGLNIDDNLIQLPTANSNSYATNQSQNIPKIINTTVDVSFQKPSQKPMIRSALQQFRFVPRIEESDIPVDSEDIKRKMPDKANKILTSQRSIFDTGNYDDLDLDI